MKEAALNDGLEDLQILENSSSTPESKKEETPTFKAAHPYNFGNNESNGSKEGGESREISTQTPQ